MQRTPYNRNLVGKLLHWQNGTLIPLTQGIMRCFTHFGDGREGSYTYCEMYYTCVSTNQWYVETVG